MKIFINICVANQDVDQYGHNVKRGACSAENEPECTGITCRVKGTEWLTFLTLRNNFIHENCLSTCFTEIVKYLHVESPAYSP